jgi:hypothetical protein
MLRHILVAFAAMATLLLFPTEVSASRPACYGVGCTGLNPMGRCDSDAKTIGAMDINGDGMLQLRWSRKCNASWGRFSTYTRAVKHGLTHTRAAAWNPGGKSQGWAGTQYGPWGEATHWTKMVTGTKRSCTGIELIWGEPSLLGHYTTPRSLGWFWGPCVD